MDDYLLNSAMIQIYSLNITQVMLLCSIVVLLVFSALISGSEIAFFSLSAKQKAEFENNSLSKRIFSAPEHLLSTILIANNFVNIGIVIISTYLIDNVIVINSQWLNFTFKVVLISFLILLFGEIIPKSYAIKYPKSLVRLMTPFYSFLNYLFAPINNLLVRSSNLVKKRIDKQSSNITVDDISEVIEMTTSDLDSNEKTLLEGIVNFQNTETKSAMRSRVNMVSIDIRAKFDEVLKVINDSGFSRIPVVDKSPDKIDGILFIKDLLPHVNKANFKWQSLIRPAYFIPETKKIDSLLRDFQLKKTHIAIVIDEYGGTAGLITLEDILEEIIGDIQDEHDEQEKKLYKKEKTNRYIFEAEISLIEFLKIIKKEKKFLDKYKGDADSLGGLMLELNGEMPQKNDVLKIGNIIFKITDVDNRRIKKIVVNIGNE